MHASTLAAFADGGGWLGVSADRAGHVTGQLAPFPANDIEGTFLSTTGCPQLHARASVNGVEATWTQVGSGAQVAEPAPVFGCAMPAFQVTVPSGLTSELEVRVWDESTQWTMVVPLIQPTASLGGDAGLRIGTWVDLALDPPPPYFVRLRFHGDAGCASFATDSTRSGGGCAADTAVSNVDCDAGPPDAGMACPLMFTDGGVSWLVPDVGAVSGTLEVDGWPLTGVPQCEGAATCWLNNAVGIGAAVGPKVVIPIQIQTVP